jgi:hypothetical protein
MVANSFSIQKGRQRQQSLDTFKRAMRECGNDLEGILKKTRYGKSLKIQLADPRMHKLVTILGKVYSLAPASSKKKWLALMQSCGFRQSELRKEEEEKGFGWKISKSTWRKAGVQINSLSLPYAKDKLQVSLPRPPPPPTPSTTTLSPVEEMEVEDSPAPSASSSAAPLPKHTSRNYKENRFPTLLPFLDNFFAENSRPCPHSDKRTMPFSVNRLKFLYNRQTERPCSLSLTCFKRIWKTYFRKNFTKAKSRDGLCQLCEISHKLDKISEEGLSEDELSRLRQKKNVILHHNLSDARIKKAYERQLSELEKGQALLTIDFKENVSLGGGPRELGQSWYKRERRTIFGLVLNIRDDNGILNKYHYAVISDCLTHDGIFVKMVIFRKFRLSILGVIRFICFKNVERFQN